MTFSSISFNYFLEFHVLETCKCRSTLNAAIIPRQAIRISCKLFRSCLSLFSSILIQYCNCFNLKMKEPLWTSSHVQRPRIAIWQTKYLSYTIDAKTEQHSLCVCAITYHVFIIYRFFGKLFVQWQTVVLIYLGPNFSSKTKIVLNKI